MVPVGMTRVGKRRQNLLPGIDGLTARLVPRFTPLAETHFLPLSPCRVNLIGGCVLPLTRDSLAKPLW